MKSASPDFSAALPDFLGEPAIDQESAGVERAHQLERLRYRRSQDVQIGQPLAGDRLHQFGVGLFRIGVLDVVERHSRRDLDADQGSVARRGDHRIERLEDEADPVLHASAVTVGALIGVRREELHRQIAGRRVQLDALEPGRQGVARRLSHIPR